MLDERKKAFFEDVEKGQSSVQLYNKYIMAGDVWIFREKYDKQWFERYNEFRLYISGKLGIHYNDIAVAGSAKIGFSLNPQKEFRTFNAESDVDIIIISQELFYRFWKEYMLASYSSSGINNKSKIMFGIFRKYLFLDGFKKGNIFYDEWEKKTKGFEKDIQLIFGIENEIHYRIFESWDAAQMYYVNGIEKCLKELEGGIEWK